MFWKALPAHLLLIGVLSLTLLAGAFYLGLGGASEPITRQFLGREQVLARASASNIKTFFETIGNSVALYAQLPDLERQGSAETVEAMDAFVDQWGDSGLVAGILLTDEAGIVMFDSNSSGIQDIGDSVTDRPYFEWAKNQQAEGKYFIGQPVVSRLGVSKGQVIIPVASPVFADGVFVGVLTAAVKLVPLTQRYLDLMKISQGTNVYLVDQNKVLLFGNPGSSMLGNSFENMLVVGEEGRFQKEGRLIAYSPVTIGSQTWTVIVAAPLKEVFRLAVPFYVRQATALVLVALITFVFGIIVTRGSQPR